MPQPRPKWPQFLNSAQRLLGGLDTPQYRAEALRDDLNPRRLLEVDQEMASRDRQHPRQQQALMDERQRLEQVQAQYVRQQAQQFPQSLEQTLDLRSRGQPLTQSPEAFMAKLMLQMRRRSGGEKAFQDWYAGHAQRQGLDPNPDAPEHFYDYRGAFRAGAAPNEEGHWPSQFKLEGHPRMVLNGVNTKTGVPE